MRCPRCLSTDCYLNNIKRSSIRPYTRPLTGSLKILGPVLALVSLILQLLICIVHIKNGNRYICRKCGYVWFKKRNVRTRKKSTSTNNKQELSGGIRLTGIDNTFWILEDTRIVIYYRGNREFVIKYDSITMVDHRESVGAGYGRLSIRKRINKYKRVPETLEGARKDRFTILYDPDFLADYQKAYYTLKKHKPK